MGKNGYLMPDSISENIFADTNGIPQGMFIQSANTSNPVLLFIHGGLGMPEYFLNEKYPVGLENHFTVCWWERRAAGLSYSASISARDITVEQFISDTIAVTGYLSDRFKHERIYLMGHSGGSFIGIQAAARAPEKYKAYIGIGQMAYQIQSEKLAYRHMLEEYAKASNRRAIRKLQQFPILSSSG